MIWIFINGRILGRSLLPVHTSLLRVSYCELVRRFMDDVTTLVGDKRRRLLSRVLCLVQSSQPSSKNIFRRRAKGEKEKNKKRVHCQCLCDTAIRYFCFAALIVDHCDRSFLFYSFFGCVCLICTKFPAGESI